MENLIKAIGHNIRVIRKGKGLSQEELAFKANLHPTYIGQVERGEKNITIVTLSTILRSLGITLESFFSLIEPNDLKKSFDVLAKENEEYLPYKELVKLLQDLNEKDQDKILEIVGLLVDWKKN
ncbi:helix-turn-helix domain-containing protein [Bacillus sp. WLY-B-L8]|uniref:helix-turn-helix domain-containing protein n=1 Tax=Bacillus multifaciens TaxID=3068506 RepID=UPI00274197E7|nr:helix-turn-helix transcriptional regulator [Bacillus sp. WLY-B-L8]MDP7979915.1 helix-turn-helix transcriptional regulator [Bacillus sp. WLY-B-L8]